MASRSGTPGAQPWSPPADDELTWFRPPAALFPERPRPLHITLDIAAFAFGASRALESLYFPLYELRPKLFDGWLYFAAVPSKMAERDLEAQARRRLDSTLRFTRDLRASWERTVRKELDGYNTFMEAFPPPASEVDLPRLKRTRANQWFAFVRAVVAPTAMAQQGIGATPPDVALGVLDEAREHAVARGTAALAGAIARLAERLGIPVEDVYGLEYAQLREALAGVSAHPAHPDASPAPPPEVIGPALPDDAPRMYLLWEILALIAG